MLPLYEHPADRSGGQALPEGDIPKALPDEKMPPWAFQ
ncbi:Protein of unknown function [Propionibacterium freudenreichii]|nr:Protein of unknown function [Propionibacterium freudenreichii]CEH10230.1 Protein of unknown function [Propionibacterium freudenreichii]